MILLLQGSGIAALVAGVVFVGAAATDRLDGYLARRLDSTTRTGQWLDPLADKLLIAATVVTLVALDRFPPWAAVVIVLREAGVSVLRAWLGTRGRAMPASSWGKAKTAGQVVAIFLYIVPLGPGADDPRFVALLIAVALTVWSGIDYVLRLEVRAPAPDGERAG